VAKQSGLGDNLIVAGYDLGADIGSLGRVGGGPATLDVTGITVSAMERIGGLRDGSMEFTAFFNPSSDRAHEVLSALPTADVLLAYMRGSGLGSPAACLNAKQVNYDGSRAADGAFTFTVTAEGNAYGLEWGEQATPGIRTDTEATDGDSLDGGADTSFGLQAYLFVTAFDGTDVTISLESSSDDDDNDAFAAVTGGSFTQVTAAPFAERIQTARDATIERYLRVVTATSAGFNSVSFLVVVVRNLTEVVF
jgi:hypothetical protein